MGYMNKKLFYLIISVIITIPFGLHGIGHKGWDPIGQMIGIGSPSDLLQTTSAVVNEVGQTDIDPSLAMANATALAQNRATTIDDVWAALSDAGLVSSGDTTVSSASPDPTATDLSGFTSTASAPVFTNNVTSITATFTTIGIKGTCTITIDPTKAIAVRTCK